MSDITASTAENRLNGRDTHRAGVLAALRGAARRGWLGPRAAAGHESGAGTGPDSLLELDLLALSVKAALERVALPLTRTARALCDARVWSIFGYARMEDFARERLGRTGRWLRDQSSLGRSLESLPALVDALVGADGGRPLGKVSSLWVGKVATTESVGAWIGLARTLTVRELKKMVREALRPGAAGGKAPEGGSPDLADRDEYCRLGMALPIEIRAAFEETLCLNRAVSGHEASVTSFIEALVAEAHAGLRPPDVESTAFTRRHGAEAALEHELAETTALWSRLADRTAPGSESALVAGALARFEDLSSRAGQGDRAELDRQIRALIDMEDELERRLSVLLQELNDLRAWERLGFTGLRHYAEQRLGLGRTAVEDRVRLARALQRHSGLHRSYESGRLGLESALLVARILRASHCDPATERAWVERAEEATVKRLRDETRALGWQRAHSRAHRLALPLDDAAWHGSLLQPPGKIRARVHELARRAIASGCSDGFLRLTLPEELAQDFLAAVESSRRRLSAEAEAILSLKECGAGGTECGTAGGQAASLEAARTFSTRGRAVPAWVGLLALLEDFVDTWDLPEASPSRRADDVYAREGWRCFAPGCTSRRNLEDHHLEYRSRGGDAKGLFNRICLCAFHHRLGEHGVLARCRGKAPLGVLWRLGRKEVGVWFRNELRLTASRAMREAG